MSEQSGFTRRDFIKASAVVSLSAALASRPAGLWAQGTDKIRVGLIGSGGRGRGAAEDCLEADPAVEIVAIGDLFQDQAEGALRRLKEKFGDRIKATPETTFWGFDNYKKVLACDINYVILAQPPHFRPDSLAAAIDAGKNVFMEKPVAVDPAGIRKVIAASEKAKEKGLGIVAGTQRRHERSYMETLQRIQDGAIGELVGGQCYWNMGALWLDRAASNWSKYQSGEWTDMEWQIRNWLFLAWQSGDHIVEQHVHNLDIINWAMGGPPAKAYGMGGRQVRTGPEFGNIFDHFAIEYEYPNGARVMSMCRQTDETSTRVSERLVGTKGVSDPKGWIRGETEWKYEGSNENPYMLEHRDLIESIRKGEPLNEGVRIAESTLTAIMGRMSAYTGRELSWKWVMNSSKLDMTPPAYEFGPLPMEPVAMPGITQLV